MADRDIDIMTRYEKTMAPPKKDTQGIMLRLPNEMIRQLDALCQREDEWLSRQDMIRRILAQHLKVKDGAN
jgi:hypothetical protein